MASEKVKRYNLVTGEDTYASQTSQNPMTSRRLRGFVPSLAGDLRREYPLSLFATSAPDRGAGGIVWLFEYAHNDQSDNVIRDFFCVTGAYVDNNGTSFPYTLYRLISGSWTQIAEIANVPQAVVINNLMHFSDGVVAWIFDGTNWVDDGFPIPIFTPSVNPQSNVGTLDILTSRFYWITFADHTPGRVHESSSSPISDGSGPITQGSVTVKPCAGTCSSTGDDKLDINIAGAGATLVAISTIQRAANVVTAHTSAPHGYAVDWYVNVSGVTNPDFNGNFFITSIVDATTFTYAQNGPDEASAGGEVSGSQGWAIAPPQ